MTELNGIVVATVDFHVNATACIDPHGDVATGHVEYLSFEHTHDTALTSILNVRCAAAKPGIAYRVTVRIVTFSGEQLKTIPASALFPLPGADGAMAVYAIENGRANLRPVRLGARNEMEAWLQAELPDGARVIVYPPATVRDGVRVNERSVAASR